LKPLDVDELIRANLRSLKREKSPGTPDVSKCLEVTRVARSSIAAHAGIVPGDLLDSVGGRPAAEQKFPVYLFGLSERRYQFYSPSTGERVRLETTAAEIGIDVRPSLAAITASYTESPDPGLLVLLWEAGKWNMLEKLAATSVPKKGFFRSSKARNTPALVLLGAALCELGRLKEGLALVHEYQERFERYWTVDYMAIARTYAARERLAARKEMEAIETLAKAFELTPFPRIADQIEKLTGNRPEKPAGFLGHRLPIDYDLPRLDGAARATLAGAVSSLSPGQLLLLVVLAGYRGNGPYDMLMRRWGSYAAHFKERLPACHVVTEKTQREAERPDWYKSEDGVRQRGLPLTLLFDRDGTVARTLQPRGSPAAWFVDRTRVVRYEGELDDVGIWDALAGAA
jgi:hypothetical protein